MVLHERLGEEDNVRRVTARIKERLRRGSREGARCEQAQTDLNVKGGDFLVRNPSL